MVRGRRRRPRQSEGRRRRRQASHHRIRDPRRGRGLPAALPTAMTNNNNNTKKKPPPTQRDRYLEDDDYGETNSPFIHFYMDHISLVPRVVKKTCPEEEVEDITRRV